MSFYRKISGAWTGCLILLGASQLSNAQPAINGKLRCQGNVAPFYRDAAAFYLDLSVNPEAAAAVASLAHDAYLYDDGQPVFQSDVRFQMRGTAPLISLGAGVTFEISSRLPSDLQTHQPGYARMTVALAPISGIRPPDRVWNYQGTFALNMTRGFNSAESYVGEFKCRQFKI